MVTNGDYKKKMANVSEKGKKMAKNGEFKGLANYKGVSWQMTIL